LDFTNFIIIIIIIIIMLEKKHTLHLKMASQSPFQTGRIWRQFSNN